MTINGQDLTAAQIMAERITVSMHTAYCFEACGNPGMSVYHIENADRELAKLAELFGYKLTEIRDPSPFARLAAVFDGMAQS